MRLTPVQINNLKVAELRTELQKRGLQTSGLKIALVRRLTQRCFEECSNHGSKNTCSSAQAREELKRIKTSVESSLEEYVCTISKELPTDPVIAMDGQIYERKEIEKWIQTKKNAGQNLTSPATNERMEETLIPTQRVYNAIHTLIGKNSIGSDLAKSWVQRIKHRETEKEEVAKTRAKAEAGDPHAFFLLAVWYDFGEKGLPQDVIQAIHWYKKSSDMHYPSGMSVYGWQLVIGHGNLSTNVSYGSMLLGRAAAAGSSHAFYWLGKWHLEGNNGFPKDAKLAKYYWMKVVDNGIFPKYKDLALSIIEEVKKWLVDNKGV